MILITTKRGILELPTISPVDAVTIQGLCFHGTSFFDDCQYCDSAMRPTFRIMEPGILGSCDCCGIDVQITDHLYKQPFGRGYYCETCDGEQNSELRADTCLGGR